MNMALIELPYTDSQIFPRIHISVMFYSLAMVIDAMELQMMLLIV